MRRPPLSGAHVPAQFHRAPGTLTPQKPFDSELAPPEQIETHTCLLKESRIAGAYGLTTRPVAKGPGSRGFAMSNLYGRTEEVFSRSYDKPTSSATEPAAAVTGTSSPGSAASTAGGPMKMCSM